MDFASVQDIVATARLSPDQRSQVISILEQYLAELERGGWPHPDDLIAQHPELAEILREYLDKLDVLHRAAVSLRSSSPLPDMSGTPRARILNAATPP